MAQSVSTSERQPTACTSWTNTAMPIGCSYRVRNNVVSSDYPHPPSLLDSSHLFPCMSLSWHVFSQPLCACVTVTVTPCACVCVWLCMCVCVHWLHTCYQRRRCTCKIAWFHMPSPVTHFLSPHTSRSYQHAHVLTPHFHAVGHTHTQH